eukprot:s527_g27.t1
MPPKLRRPAAAVARPRRRPAAVVPRERGWVVSSEAKLEEFSPGKSLVIEGEYWEGAVELAGQVRGAQIDGPPTYLKIRATGTKSEALLRYLTGTKDRELTVHLCGSPCDAKVWREDLVHANRLKEAEARREDWMDNLGEMREEEREEDVNERLRKEAEEAREELQRREKTQQEAKESRLEKKKKKKKKSGHQVKASAGKKELSLIYGGTGMDPDPTVRKQVIRKAKKVRKRGKKKRRRSSSSGSSSSLSTSSTSSEVIPEVDIFEGEKDSQRLWKRTPGALTLATILEAQQSLLTRQGVHPEVHKTALPPIMTQYYRSNLQPIMGPALSRECHHWALMLDLLLQGEAARAADLGCQRLKSLESYARGTTLDVARHLELVPPEKPALAGQAETSQAGKLALEESKIHAKTRLAVREEHRQEKERGREAEKRIFEGVPGSIDSRKKLWKKSEEETKDSCESGSFTSTTREGELTTVLPPVASEPQACLPEGSLSGGIQSLNSFAELLEWVWDVLKNVRFQMRRQLTTAWDTSTKVISKDDIFPLPTSQKSTSTLKGTISALNDLAGFAPAPGVVNPPDSSEVIQKGLSRLVDRFDVWETPKPQMSFKQLFTSKTIDYSGEEVKVAQRLKWSRVQASLPDGVGCLPLEDFCRLGTLHVIQNFEEHLLPPDAIQVPKPPAVMVEPDSWEEICLGLTSKNICEIWPLEDIYHHNGTPLLNGLFAVGKGEYINGEETQRLIMNLTPVNSISRNLSGDVGTLPGLSGFSGFLLEDGQVALLSSEDIRCFFYLFAIPQEWKRYMAFSKVVPPNAVPECYKGRTCVLVSRVLPMGYVNSVSIAQHIHRNIVRWSAASLEPPVGREQELRKDQGMSTSSSLFRIYLDNFDQVERVDKATAEAIKGTPSAQVMKLRQDYSSLGLPRHPKKAVERQYKAEVQGAIFDGKLGFAMPKPDKVWQYALLAAELLEKKKATLKELQIVCGGFVYMCMFRRPLLCSLNEVWSFMQRFGPEGVRKQLPDQVVAELARFVLLMPLAQMEFRAPVCEQVSVSDASMLGGGICVSEGLTEYGVAAANSQVRGDIPETHDLDQVLTVGLFDGIRALRVAADTLGLPMAGHVSVELDAKGRRVVESWFPGSVFFEDVKDFGDEQIRDLALQFSNVALVIIGAGPPCQGVSGLNYDKKGALKDSRSSLFQEVPRIEQAFRNHFPWAQVHRLMESVASMSSEDRDIMSKGVESSVFRIDAFGLTLCHRPRLYWPTWELVPEPEALVVPPPVDDKGGVGTVVFCGQPDPKTLLEPGWKLADEWGLPTFTTSRPRSSPGRRPAGLESCAAHEIERWTQDSYRFPPYQYKDGAGLVNRHGVWRRPGVAEREALMGFPVGFTAPCVPKGEQKGDSYDDSRLSLLGNSWQVGVIVWLLSQLCAPLGLCAPMCVSEIVAALTPGGGQQLQTLLLRPPLCRAGQIKCQFSGTLVKKLLGIVSVKGEDLLLQSNSRSKEERKEVRKNLGTLKSLTVQPQTRLRYERARADFYSFLHENALVIPKQPHGLDCLLADFIEHLWSSGEGRGKAADTVAAVQDLQPHVKGQWRLLKTWAVNEIPSRAPPLPEVCLQAMVGWAIFKEEYKFGLSLLLAYYGLLRTGELLDVKSSHVFLESPRKPAVVSLGLTKGGKRMGAAESVSISVELVLTCLKAWKKSSSPHQFLCPSPSKWRALFSDCIEAVGLTELGFRPYSLRRGGATHWFSKHGNLDRVVVMGRWQAQRTARIYINEGLSVMAEMAVPKVKLRPFLTVFRSGSPKPRFA